jgi:type II secretory pathway component PulF
MAVTATGNTVVGDMFRPAVANVRAGGSIGEKLSPKLPRELVEMWKIGEESGTLDNVTRRLAENYTESAEFWLHEFARWMPRFVYMLVCLMMIYYILRNAVHLTSMY